MVAAASCLIELKLLPQTTAEEGHKRLLIKTKSDWNPFGAVTRIVDRTSNICAPSPYCLRCSCCTVPGRMFKIYGNGILGLRAALATLARKACISKEVRCACIMFQQFRNG